MRSNDAAAPRVSVHMPAYNHERYIAQAIESALMQRTNFDFEIVIGEDCSTDGTRAVVMDYVRSYPDKVRAIFHERNTGIFDNNESILGRCRGEYIAWLESDDYWTDSGKLQKQVDLLDANVDYAACFHWARRVGDSEPVTWRQGPPVVHPFYTLDDLLSHGHFAPSCTVMFRAELARPALEWTRATPFLETTYLVRFALNGKIGFIDEEMAIYRYHSGGIYGRATDRQNFERAIETHELLGLHCGLMNRPSWQRGMERLKALSLSLPA